MSPDAGGGSSAVHEKVAPRADAQARTWTSLLRSVWVMGPALAVLQGFLVNSGAAGFGSLEQAGYTAGTSDHYVLGPGGLRLEDPTRFANDFFLNSSPEPHWFFDYVTALGAATNLSVVYLIYWFLGLAFFGFGAAILARRWAPRMSWAVGIAFTVTMSLAPWAVAGTGSPMIASAIPAVVGGYAAFLAIAAMLSGHRKAAAAMATVTAILHVQQGLVVALVMVVLFVTLWVRDRRPAIWIGVGAVGATAGTAYGLIHSGFGASVADFVQVCDEMIPYHCAAHLWLPETLFGAVALIALSGFSIRLVARGDRPIWYATVGLIGFGLLSGMMADALRIPLLGTLAQGSNIYRLGALVIFFAVWGLLSFLVKPARTGTAAVVAIAWLLVAWAYLSSGGWQFSGSTGRRIYLVLLPLALLAATWPWLLKLLRRSDGLRPPRSAGVLLFTAVLVVAAVMGGFLSLRPLNATYIPDDDKREWGEAVEALVPPGEVLLHSPNAQYIRLATKRADIADCKNVPYGGEPYAEWKERIDDLGGWSTQCRNGFSIVPFNDLTAEELDRTASKYGVTYMVIEEAQVDVLPDLADLGWSVELEPINDLNNYLLKKD